MINPFSAIACFASLFASYLPLAMQLPRKDFQPVAGRTRDYTKSCGIGQRPTRRGPGQGLDNPG